jgi:hypothetical protein
LPDVRVETVICNSAPAVIVYSGDHLEGVFLLEIIDGKITNFAGTNSACLIKSADLQFICSRS